MDDASSLSDGADVGDSVSGVSAITRYACPSKRSYTMSLRSKFINSMSTSVLE